MRTIIDIRTEAREKTDPQIREYEAFYKSAQDLKHEALTVLDRLEDEDGPVSEIERFKRLLGTYDRMMGIYESKREKRLIEIWQEESETARNRGENIYDV